MRICFRLKFPLAPGETESPPVVTISLMIRLTAGCGELHSVRVVASMSGRLSRSFSTKR